MCLGEGSVGNLLLLYEVYGSKKKKIAEYALLTVYTHPTPLLVTVSVIKGHLN